MRSALFVSALTVCWWPALAAESAPRPEPPAEARPPIFAPAVKKAPASRLRLPPVETRTGSAISPDMARKLAGMAERVAPAAAAGNASAVSSAPPADAAPDAVIMDPFVVDEKKEAKLNERRLLTPKEKLELALRTNPGLKLGPVPLGNNAVALELLEDEFERQRRGELTELGSVLNSAGKKAPPEVQRQINEGATRKNDWLNQRPGTPFREPR